MKKIPMIIIILSCIAVSVASVVLSHSNDNKAIANVKIINAPTDITTHTSTKYDNYQTTVIFPQIYSTETSVSTTETTIDENNKPNDELFININTADLGALCLLNGIGETIAAEIIKYREENGGFRNIEEIMNVNRIGEKIFNKIRDNIYVDDPYYPNEITDIFYEEETHNIETQAVQTAVPLTLDDVAPIELNSADKELLMYLPYVDENIADQIIDIRERIHGFKYIYEIAYIEELSDEQIAEIIQYIYIAE